LSLPEVPPSYRFGAFELDIARKQLRRAGVVVPIAPKPFELLALLVRHADRIVSRKEALASVWPDVRVSGATLASTVRDLRRALDDDADTPAFVQTARGLGFRFVAPVESRRTRASLPDSSGCAPFVDRQALLERLEDALGAAAGGRGRMLLLEGEPGIGKTRALAVLASLARASDAIVCQARFPESGGGSAYRPWGQLLKTLVEARPSGRLADELGPALPWVARLVPGLSAGPDAGGDDDERTTLRLFDAVATFLRRVSRSVPLVLVLDDLHGADRSSLRLLEYVADQIHDARILIVGAYRSCELDPEHPLPATLAELARGGGYARHRLEGVTLSATRELVLAATGCEPEAAQLAEIHERTDGNPFYVLELTRYLAETAHGDARSPVPPSLCELLRGRLQRLPLRCRDTLELASVVGREFELELLRRASGLDVSDLTDALVLGRRAGLVEIGWGDTRRFRHALVQEAIYAGLPEARRRLLHRRVGEAYRTLLSEDRPDRLASAAHHLCQVAEEVGPAAHEAALAAAEHAEAELAFEEAERLYSLALDALDRIDPDDRVRRCPLLLALARSQLRAGEVGRAVDTARRAAALARGIGRPDRMAEAALLFADYVLADSSEPKALFQEALAALGPEHEALRGRSLAALAGALWYEGQIERRLALAEEALAIARRLESPSDLVIALLAKRHVLMAPEQLAERLRLVDQALREAHRRSNHAQRAQVLSWRAGDLMESGDRAAAERDVTELEEIARASHLRRYLDHPSRWRALLAMMEGRFEEAEKWIAESARWRQRANFQNAESYALIQGALLMRERGRQTELAAIVRNAPWLDEYRTRVPTVRATIALVELEGGHPGAARRVLHDVAADDYAALASDPDLLCTASWLAEICARLGASAEADALYERLAPWRERVAGVYAITCRGSMARYLGLLATTAGRHEEAAACFDAALEGNRAIGASLYEAWTQWEYARLLGSRGQCGPAETLAKEARVTADRLGLHKLAAEIDRVVPVSLR
jgi:predicted ATPase/DNA-binding winged helix-turn-helix (wHTH) protein